MKDMIRDPSLVLYANLRKHDGAQFMSDDQYGRLFAVTGATWGFQGRTFDATDDIIKCTPLVVVCRSIIFWFKPTTQVTTASSAQVLMYFDAAQSHDYICTGAVTGLVANETLSFMGANQTTCVQNLTLTATWHFFAFVYNTSLARYDIYYDNALQTVVTGDSHRGLITSGMFQLGRTVASSANGIFGDALLYTRALTPAELTNFHLATKWRYQ